MVPFYDYEYTHSQRKVLEWLFMMFSYDKESDGVSDSFGEYIKIFSLSKNRMQVEMNNGIVLNKTPRQLYRLTLGYSPSKEAEHHRDLIAAWTGDVYLMLNWRFGIPCAELAKLNWSQIYHIGGILSEASCVNACKKIIENYHLVPRCNDTRMTF